MDRTPHRWWTVAGIVGALGVLSGAFAAHGLSGRLDATHLEWWRTGAQYHLIHAVALLGAAAHPGRPTAARWLFLVGIGVFSGSLYVMALSDLRWLGAVTPLGGLALVAGWIALALKRPSAGTIDR